MLGVIQILRNHGYRGGLAIFKWLRYDYEVQGGYQIWTSEVAISEHLQLKNELKFDTTWNLHRQKYNYLLLLFTIWNINSGLLLIK